ncbi:Heterokaryon incompatibility protein 6 OR allele, partial [Lachnellula suecica]
MRKFLKVARRTPEPEPSPPVTPALPASHSPYLEPPNDGTLKYKPLRLEREFRVLVLLPGSGEDEIACILDNVYLDDWLTHYEALSYMWGPAEPIFPISVDGGTSFVRKNLLNALKALRHPTESRLLFIDALCINRSDVLERNRMVANMSQIYQRATKVLVWLGDGDEVSDFAFGKVNQNMPWADLSAPLERATASTLANIFNRPYWRRVWVLQELLSGYNLEVYCGTKQAPWMQFIAVMGFLDAKVKQGSEEVGKEKLGVGFAKWCIETPGMAILRLQNGQTPRQHKMADLIEVCRKCESECYDVRDRIYGLVSITMQEAKGLKIEPDYAKIPAQLCVDTFLADFSKDNAQFRISAQGLTPQPEHGNNLLASQRSNQQLLEEPLWNKDKKAFDALVSVVDKPESYHLRNSFSKASIRGLITISWTSDVLSANSSSKTLFAHLEVDALYKHRDLRLPDSIAKVKSDVAKLSVRDYHSTEQLR